MEEVDRQPLSVTICSICKLRNPPIGENWKRICWRALARGTLARGTRQRRASQRRTGPQGSVHLRPPRCPATAAQAAPRRLRVRVGPRGRKPPLCAPAPRPVPPPASDTDARCCAEVSHRHVCPGACATGRPPSAGAAGGELLALPGGWNSSNIRSLLEKYWAASKHD